VVAHPSAPEPEGAAGSVEISFRQYRAELRIFFARRARRSANVEDLVQEVYERLLRRKASEPIRDPEAYVFQVARNVLRAANREASREQHQYLSCDPVELEGRVEGLRHLWVQEDGGPELAQEEIERVLNQLPRGCRVALLRQRRDGWTYQQIADELGVSINTVKDYLGKAFNHFRIYFSLHSGDR
jgi:RNA polymerase sigma factor (sigma-70 family)